jgi:sarcosine oxidase subunit gamma
MAEAASLHRPLAFAPADWLATVPSLGRFVFRGDGSAREAAGRAFGVVLPETACRAAVDSSSARAALWLGPDEHLLLAPEADRERAPSEIAQGLGAHAHSLVDVSHRQVALSITGPRAEWLLESQCPLPLNDRDFPVGMCTRTVYAKAEIVLWRTEPQAFHIEVWRSFSAYVVALLREVARELDR